MEIGVIGGQFTNTVNCPIQLHLLRHLGRALRGRFTPCFPAIRRIHGLALAHHDEYILLVTSWVGVAIIFKFILIRCTVYTRALLVIPGFVLGLRRRGNHIAGCWRSCLSCIV